MRRPLGLLMVMVMVMGMVGCGGEGEAPPAGEAALPATPNKPQTKVDEPPVQTVDASKLVNRDGLAYEGDSETPFTGVMVEKHENGQKKAEGPFKDGKIEGLVTEWYENGKKRNEGTYKDGKEEGLRTGWYENGQKSLEVTLKDGKPEGLATRWHENGQKSREEIWKDGKKVSGTKWDKRGQRDQGVIGSPAADPAAGAGPE